MIRIVALSMLFAATASADSKPPELEPISVTNIVPHKKSTTISIRAASGGCVRPADFRVDVDKQGARQVMSIVRIKPDVCDMYAPNGATFDLEVTNIAADTPVVLANPLFVSSRSK